MAKNHHRNAAGGHTVVSLISAAADALSKAAKAGSKAGKKAGKKKRR